MEHRKKEAYDLEEMLYQEAKRKRDERHYYRNLILRSVASLFIGIILMAFLEAFGLGGLLVALLLCGCGAMFALCV